jgi:hypothetical protein
VRESARRELGEEIGIDVDGADLEQLVRVRCELDGETELTTVFRLRHPGPYRLAPPELAGLAVLAGGTRPAPLSPSAALLNQRLDADHPGWDTP